MRGHIAWKNALRGLFQQHRIESTGTVQEVEVSGDLAYCWTNLRASIVPLSNGHFIVRSGSRLSILHKQVNGSWVVVRDANLLPPPA